MPLDLPRLSVVVPCRDEAERLPALLDALASQDHPDLEVLVVDDGSTDGSPQVARDMLARAAAETRPGAGAWVGRVLTAPPLPAEWAGKSWACHQGVAAATGRHILFLDADTLPSPGACSALAGHLVRSRAAAVSGVTRYAMPTAREQLCVPGFPMTIHGFLPLWLLAVTGGRPAAMAFAYGPLMLVDRAAYLASGGHAARPGSEREDIDLARTIVESGRSVALVRAAGLAATRHYPDGTGALVAWRRVFVGYGGGSLAVALTGLAGAMICWLLPLVVPLLGLVTGDPVLVAGGAVALTLLLLFRLILAARELHPPGSILAHPVTVLLTMGAQVASIADAVRGRRPTWRGRVGRGVSP